MNALNESSLSRKGILLLVPGFFAFDQVANIPYFAGVERLLPTVFARHGVDMEFDVVSLPPTAAIEVRAWALLQRLSVIPDDGRSIYLVGHSSGGLDIRFALQANAKQPLAEGPKLQKVLNRVRAVTTISTPHYGTPLARLATGLRAHQVLNILSRLFVLVFRHGRLPMGFMIEVGRWLAKIDEYVGLRGEVLDQLYRELLTRAPKEYFEGFETHFQRVGAAQGLIADLSPERCRDRNRSCIDRPTVRYGCVLSQVSRSSWWERPRLGNDPYAHFSYLVFRVLQRISGSSALGDLPRVCKNDHARVRMNYGRVPTPSDSDGIVPTCSQLWGRLVDAVEADHFDTMGYFSGREIDPTHVNWLASGSGFSALRFEQMWRRVAAHLLDEPVFELGPSPQNRPALRATVARCLPPSSSL